MDSKKSSNFYIIDFLKSLMKPRNIPVIIYLLVDSFFVFIALMLFVSLFIEGKIQNRVVLDTLCAIFAVIIYVDAIVLSLSPIGEMFLRFKLKCKEITDPEILNRVVPLFKEVYARAKRLNPGISDNVHLYIQENDDPNAFATGRCTVCITTALLAYDDEQIKAILAHEFGHLANKDTDLILVINVANTFMHLLFLVAWAVLIVIRLIMRIYTLIMAFAGEGASAIGLSVCELIYTVFAFVFVRLAEKLWNIIGNLVIMFSSRGSEFNADLFAQKLGYGNGLIRFFETLPDSRIGKKTPFRVFINKMSTIGDSHPATWRRIENLRNYAKQAPANVAR